MRPFFITIMIVLFAAIPSVAAEFLGATLCKGSVDTSVILPVDSPLSLESAEIGRHGGLLLLLKTDGKDILDEIDDLMAGYTNVRGAGDEKKLQWSGNGISAYAQVIKKGYAALAISSEDDCQKAEEAKAAAVAEAIESAPDLAAEEPDVPVESIESAASEAVATTAVLAQANEPVGTPPEFELKGQVKHSRADGTWVDVMGVVVNRSGSAYQVANFDLSFYDVSGELICVDAISVSQLRAGQERAFRDSVRCADYVRENVATWKLQFSGGH